MAKSGFYAIMWYMIKEIEGKPNRRVQKQENALLNMLLNIVIPAIMMMKGKQWFGLSPEISLSIALAFPVLYGIYDFVVRRKFNFLSILGFVSILLTGGIGLLKLSKEWIAIKEAAVPLIIGLAVLISLKTPWPLIRTFLYNEAILNTNKIDSILVEKGKMSIFEKLLVRCTWLVAFSFLLSAALNFGLAKIIVHSETGTQAFTEELGRMTALSYPVIALPCTIVMVLALWRLFSGIRHLTGLELEEVFNHPSLKKRD